MDSSFVDHEEEVSTMNTYSCDSCGKTFKTLTNLKRHLDDTCSDKLFQCETCDKQFTAKRNLLSHHKRRHQQSDTTYRCPHCGKKYLAESSMYSHVRYINIIKFSNAFNRFMLHWRSKTFHVVAMHTHTNNFCHIHKHEFLALNAFCQCDLITIFSLQRLYHNNHIYELLLW
jgi:DNA-directed RNA polymerase subunit RPC12/RpoP